MPEDMLKDIIIFLMNTLNVCAQIKNNTML